VLEDEDPALFVAAIGEIARAKGMAAIAKKSEVTRVIYPLGMKLSVHA